MTIKQLTTPKEIVDRWPLFAHGFQTIAQKGRESFDEGMMLKTVLWLVGEPDFGYINFAEKAGTFVGFSIWQDATPMFVLSRSFIARAVYTENGNQTGTVLLLRDFEKWAREKHIDRYIVSTRRHSGAALRHFQSPKFGLLKGAITFEKEIT